MKNIFPKKPDLTLKRLYKLFLVTKALKKQQQNKSLSALSPSIDKSSLFAWQRLVKYNPNNLGNWFQKEYKLDMNTSQGIEKKLVSEMADLLKAKGGELEGYLTSGATESNIFSGWLGKKYLVKKSKSKICLLKSDLSHYSISKTADILDVKTFTLKLNDLSWAIDVESFSKDVIKISKQGFKNFLVPLTFGYTLTGTQDPYQEICRQIRILKKTYKLNFFIWIDSAFNGMVEPFINDDFNPFALPEIQTFVLDFHKNGHVPLSTGLILYRKGLRTLIEKPIDYLSQTDATLLGSRSGIPAVASWFAIHTIGKDGYRTRIKKNMSIMNQFIKDNIDIKGLKFIFRENSLNCGIIAYRMDKEILKFSNKFGLEFRKTKLHFVSGYKILQIAKCFFVN